MLAFVCWLWAFYGWLLWCDLVCCFGHELCFNLWLGLLAVDLVDWRGAGGFAIRGVVVAIGVY